MFRGEGKKRRDGTKKGEGKKIERGKRTIVFQTFPAGGYPMNITSFLRSLGHTVTVDSVFAVVQGVKRESSGNVTAHSDSRKMGQPYLLSS